MIEDILTRRSIRKYQNKKVEDCLIDELLRAGMAAPSAGNQQPWDFIVIRDKEIMNKIPEFHPYSAMIKDCDVAIVVCGNLEKEKNKGFWVQDCSAATENILLAAHARGLGAVWLGLYPREERSGGIKKLLNIPENIIPLSLIPIGYPGEDKGDAKRFDKNSIHYDKW